MPGRSRRAGLSYHQHLAGMAGGLGPLRAVGRSACVGVAIVTEQVMREELRLEHVWYNGKTGSTFECVENAWPEMPGGMRRNVHKYQPSPMDRATRCLMRTLCTQRWTVNVINRPTSWVARPTTVSVDYRSDHLPLSARCDDRGPCVANFSKSNGTKFQTEVHCTLILDLPEFPHCNAVRSTSKAASMPKARSI